MIKKILVGGLGLFLAGPVFAVTVAPQKIMVLDFNAKTDEVSLSYDARSRWAPNDSLCAFVQNRKVFCGMVVRATPQKFEVRVDQKESDPRRGTWVILRPLSRAVAAQTTEQVVDRYQESKTHDISVGLAAGFNYFFPVAHLQLALGKEFSIGVLPLYVSYADVNSSVTAYGGFFTAAYYITHFPFRGFFAEGGVGFYNITATSGTSSEAHTQMAGSLTMQWRGRASWDLGLDIGVGAGIQYIVPVDRALTQAFSGILPLFTVCLGWPF